MTALSALMSLAPYHLLLYGTLLGTELYQSFVMTKICYLTLPTSAFTSLQRRVFPIYFQLQTLLVALTAVTYPPCSFSSLARSTGDLLPLAFAGVTAMLNLVIYGPRTSRAMVERIHQETKDGRKHNDPTEISEEMRVRTRAFSKNHAMAIHLNLLSMGATLWYGVRLASRLKFGES